jgi:hypothetical protein
LEIKSKSDDEDDYDYADDGGGIAKGITLQEMEKPEDNTNAPTKSFLAGEEYENELIIEAAGHHVLQSKSIRGRGQYRTKQAIEFIID